MSDAAIFVHTIYMRGLMWQHEEAGNIFQPRPCFLPSDLQQTLGSLY